MIWIVLLLVGALVLLLAVAATIRARNLQYWLSSYLADVWSGWNWAREHRTLHVYVCFADHFEPYGGGGDTIRARAKVERWVNRYCEMALQHVDSFGGHPKHTFFYPIEEYDPKVLDRLAEVSKRGLGDVEVHYHHDNDTAPKLTEAIEGFVRTLRSRHGLLREDENGRAAYCFIHGNWALDNSRPDGRWCGVDNEISVLVATGCRADFTMPSAPSDTQTRKINSIYAARGVPGRRKSHNDGRDIEVGEWVRPDELLMVQGPLALNWRKRKAGVLPKIENSEISHDAPPSADRLPLWLRFAPRVRGAEEHVFIKLHTHGAEDDTMAMLMTGGFEALWSTLESGVRDHPGRTLRYVSAWEMFVKIRELATASGHPR